MARCRAPAANQVGLVELSLQYAHMSSDASAVQYTYFNMNASIAPPLSNSPYAALTPLVNHIFPHVGPSAGGTTVTLYGKGLINHAGHDPVSGEAASGVFCNFEPPAHIDLPSLTRDLKDQILKMEARILQLRSDANVARETLASRIFPEASKAMIEEPGRLDAELAKVSVELDQAQGTFTELKADGFDTVTRRAHIAYLSGMVAARPISDGNEDAIICTTPEVSNAVVARSYVTARVRVILNGEASAASTASVNFHYYSPRQVRLRMAVPQGGPTKGGTEVLVHVSAPRGLHMLIEDGISAQRLNESSANAEDRNRSGAPPIGVQCIFGSTRVPGTRLLPSDADSESSAVFFSVRCVSPPVHDLVHQLARREHNRSSEVALTISLNGGKDIVHQPAIRWLYYPLHRIRISQLSPMGGPSTGATMVRVLGTHFRRAGGVGCLFGQATLVPATWISFEQINCISPHTSHLPSKALARDATGWRVTDVCVVLNGDTNACAGYTPGVQARFAYYDASVIGRVSRISPTAGPVAGGTVVSVWGHAFRELDPDSGGLACAFGSQLSKAVQISGEQVNSTNSNGSQLAAGAASSMLQCLSPAAVTNTRSSHVHLHVLMNADMAIWDELAHRLSPSFTFFES